MPTLDAQIRQALSGLPNRGDERFHIGSTNGDASSLAYIAGRDHKSGTWINTFGFAGLGIFAAPNQTEVDPATWLTFQPMAPGGGSRRFGVRVVAVEL